MLSTAARALSRRGRAAAALARRAPAAAFSSGSHDDFAPKSSAGVDDVTQTRIKAMVSDDDVVLFMKGTPNAPQCGFSNMACRVLDLYEVDYHGHNVLADPALREGVKQYSQWPTIPQLFVRGEFVGGSDILLEMHKADDLEKLLKPDQ